MQWNMDQWIFGVLHLQISVLVTQTGDVREMQVEARITWIQFKVLDSDLLIPFHSLMEQSKSEHSFRKEIGFDLQFGYFQSTMNSVTGQHQVKLIWLNPGGMICLASLGIISSVQLFIGDLAGKMMLLKKLLLNSQLLITQPW